MSGEDPKGENAVENRMFRQESIDQVNSQEQIKDYLRVTSPKLWMVILAVLVLLAGFLAYISTAEKEITVPVRVKAETVQTGGQKQTKATFEIPTAERDNYMPGMPVRFAGVTGKIRYFVETEDTTEVTVQANDPEAEVTDGEYDAAVVIESSTPIDELLK